MSVEVDFELFPWQQEAVERWVRGDSRGLYRGTLEIFTGGGKTLIALAAWREATRLEPDVRLAIVVPTEALARQWQASIVAHTNTRPEEIGVLGAGQHADFSSHRVLISVINSAAKQLPDLARAAQPLMLVVDEYHRAGAPTFQRVLDTRADFRLGLSATPDREEVDDDGEPIEYDEHVLGRKLGEVVSRFSLGDARRVGWLPEYVIHHHGIHLLASEQIEYGTISRRIDEVADQLASLGGDTTRARAHAGRRDELGEVSRQYVSLTSRRKDLLYRASERQRVALRIVAGAKQTKDQPHILLFHERVGEAEELYVELKKEFDGEVGLEHSRLSDARRVETLQAFRDGSVSVLVSVKSLIEGIDVPAADVGVSVASSSSVRQRIQSLGRVLRRQFDAESDSKVAEMHVLYVVDTVDEIIYAKEDWSDLTGQAANHYWVWPLDPDAAPELQDEPPLVPRPTEEQEWERLGERAPMEPVEWRGAIPDREYSVDTSGTVTTRTGAVVTNPQGVDEMIMRLRERPGGRFYVTPAHHLVVAWTQWDGEPRAFVVGQLAEPFSLLESGDRDGGVPDVASLNPGDPYEGPLDDSEGTFMLRQRRGGMIERRRGREVESAFEEGTGNTGQEQNARALLDAWRSLAGKGITVKVNHAGHAWFLDGGRPRFLASVDGGFVFPSDLETQEGRQVG